MKKYILFGAGNFGKRALKYYGESNVECFVDNCVNKIGETIGEKRIIGFDEYKDIAEQYETIITSSFIIDMEKQLLQNGITQYVVYSPYYERFIKRLEKNLKENMANVIAFYGVDKATKYLVSAIHIMGLDEKLKYIIIPDKDEEIIGTEIFSYKICKISDVKMKVDSYYVSSETNNAALYAQLRKRVGQGLVINPFKQRAMYDTDEIVHNPYIMEDSEMTEEKWNKVVESNEKKAAIRAYVEVVQKDVPLFEFVEIETINRCNGTCSFCPVNKLVDTRIENKMSIDLFESIIGQLEEIEYSGALSLFSNNEPLLDERIIMLHKYARVHLPKARLHLFTNGTLFTLEKFIELIDYLDELIIDNYRQDLQLIKPCKEIKEYVENHPELRKKVTIVLRKPKEILTSRGGDAPNRHQLVSYGEESCALPFQQIIIRPDGKVSLCCNDALGKCTLGDLKKQTILDIWYGTQFQMVRKRLIGGRKNWKHCENCDTFYIY